MKKILPLIAFAIIMSGCKKDRATSSNSPNPLIKISLAPVLNDVSTANTWTQVLGGRALISFQMGANDNLTASPIQDSVSLKDIALYKRDVVAGNYTITLNRTNTALADTFIRFNAQAKDLSITKDQAISLPATTNDGLITVDKSLIQPSMPVLFIDTSTGKAYFFSVANGYFYLYIKGGTTGRLIFIEKTSSDTYLKDITIAAQNRYDISVVPTSTNQITVTKQALSFKGFLGNIQ